MRTRLRRNWPRQTPDDDPLFSELHGANEFGARSRECRVFVKLTSTPSCSTKAYPYRNIHPYLKRLIEAFGPRRCFWGTDLSAMLSRTNCAYRQAVTMFTEEMNFLSEEDLEFVMGRGLAECLPWPVAQDQASSLRHP